MTRTVGIYIFDNVEVLDFAGPYEVFNTASRVHLRSHTRDSVPFAVRLIASESDVVEARGGMRILPDVQISARPGFDVLIVPGGVVDQELEKDELSKWIRSLYPSAEIVASVCTGAFILAQAKLLENLSATTHWEDIERFSRLFPGVDVVGNTRWVEQGKILTSAGISSGIDMCLHIVGRLKGEDLALRTARQMEHRWQQDPTSA